MVFLRAISSMGTLLDFLIVLLYLWLLGPHLEHLLCGPLSQTFKEVVL